MKILYIFDDLLQPRRDRITAAVGDGAEEHIKIRDFVAHAADKIAVRHGKLVKIAQQRKIAFGHKDPDPFDYLFKSFKNFS